MAYFPTPAPVGGPGEVRPVTSAFVSPLTRPSYDAVYAGLFAP